MPAAPLVFGRPYNTAVSNLNLSHAWQNSRSEVNPVEGGVVPKIIPPNTAVAVI